LLIAAKEAIDLKTTETHDDFLQRVTLNLQQVEQQAQSLSAEIARHLREHLNRGVGEFHQQVIDAGKRLKQLSEDLLQGMEYSLGELHDTHRRELEQVQATVAAESSRVHEQIVTLDARLAKLNESVSQLESGLDKRLSQMSSDTIRSARSQLDSALDVVLADLSTRNAQELGNQLDEAKGNLQTIQKRIETSVSELLKMQVVETFHSFERDMEEAAGHSVERWRHALAGALNSVGKHLDEQFRLQAAPDCNPGKQCSAGS
jgi:primosomal protein N''